MLTQANLKKFNSQTQPQSKSQRPTSASSVNSSSMSEPDDNEYELTNISRSSTPQHSRISPRSSAPTPAPAPAPAPTPRQTQDASKIYNDIKKSKEKIVQSSTDHLPILKPKHIIEKEMDKLNLPNYYMFVMQDNNIINIFESVSEFILKSTNSYEAQSFFPNNYITTSRENDFNSIFDIKTQKIESNFINKQTYNSFRSYDDIIKNSNSSVIQFFIYKHDESSKPVTTYFTYGDIFIYEYGIASTCEIKLKNKEELEKKKQNVVQYIKKDQNRNVSINYIGIEKKTDYIKLIQAIKTDIYGSDIYEDNTKTPISNEKTTISKEKVFIYFLNAILPDELRSIINEIITNNITKPNLTEQIQAVIKILYINISYPPPSDEEKFNVGTLNVGTLNELHKNINYYYAYKNDSDLESEYAKEKRLFGQQKINKYIEILQGINNETNYYSQFVMHIFDFFEFLMFLKDKDKGIELINACITIYQHYYAAYQKSFETLNSVFTDKKTGESNKIIEKVVMRIQDKIKIKVKKPYTYLQIINNTTKYNKRFKIGLNNYDSNIDHGQSKKSIDSETSMEVDYIASNLKFYDKQDNEINKSIRDTNNNKNTYKFGPFNHIYKPSENVSTSNHFETVIAQIRKGSPMMFSFHGHSGSGKTSVLKPVFLTLCNKLGNEYNTLNIKFEEFFKKYDGDVETVKTQVFNLKFDGKNFNISTETTHTPYHKTRIEILNRLNKQPTQPINKDFNKTHTLEIILKYFLEEDRLIKGFPTNYNSSRSHVLCFLEFINETKNETHHVIFGDLAGNEKEYDCNSDISRFINIKTKDNTSFYENEFDSTGEKFDLYDGGSKQSNMKEEGVKSGLYKTACEHRLPEGKFINDSLKDFRKELEYMIDVKNRENAYYVPYFYLNNNGGFTSSSCLKDFCFGKTSCFNFRKVGQITEPSSVIMRSVYDYLSEKKVITDDVTDFYDTLEVCIFGILNISTNKNDPPVIQYNDINGVKSVLYGSDEFTFNSIPELFTSFKAKLELCVSNTNRLLLQLNKDSSSSYPYATYINELLKKCQYEINKKEKTGLTLAEIETFNSVFELIDDENAKTVIGTLEFMNRISKLNTINSICSGDSENYVPLYNKK